MADAPTMPYEINFFVLSQNECTYMYSWTLRDPHDWFSRKVND